jgi:hypothetical protein
MASQRARPEVAGPMTGSREAIQGGVKKTLDCFVANAPRNDDESVLRYEANP